MPQCDPGAPQPLLIREEVPGPQPPLQLYPVLLPVHGIDACRVQVAAHASVMIQEAPTAPATCPWVLQEPRRKQDERDGKGCSGRGREVHAIHTLCLRITQ